MLEVRRATLADATDIVVLGMKSFAHDMANNTAFQRNPDTDEYTPEVMSWLIRRAERELADIPSKHTFKLMDTELEGEPMIAYASWVEPRTKSQFKEDNEADEEAKKHNPMPEGVNKEFTGVVADLRKENLKELFGTEEEKDYWYLHYLGTLPDHQGRGAASKLLRWGFEKADAEGKRVFIESTPVALGFYERNGCVKKGETVMLDGKYRFHLMIREPKGSQGT